MRAYLHFVVPLCCVYIFLKKDTRRRVPPLLEFEAEIFSVEVVLSMRVEGVVKFFQRPSHQHV